MVRWQVLKFAYNVLQLNADFVLHKNCDLGDISRCNFIPFVRWDAHKINDNEKDNCNVGKNPKRQNV